MWPDVYLVFQPVKSTAVSGGKKGAKGKDERLGSAGIPVYAQERIDQRNSKKVVFLFCIQVKVT